MGLWPSLAEDEFAVVLPGQDGALVLAWSGWMTGCCCCFMVSGSRPRVMGLLEAWGDSAECSGDSNTVVMNGRVGFPKKKLVHQWPGSALGRPGDWGTASPGYSALPQELLLDEEPRRRR